MKLPKEIKSRHKIRDAGILHLFLNDNMTLKEIGLRFSLTASRIQQILYENKHLIDWDKNYEKAVRINALKRLQKKYESVLGKKSTIDILEQQRKELEGDKPLVDQSHHHSVQIINYGETIADKNTARRIPAA